MKILFLSQRVPYPPVRGDKIATWKLIERMRRDHEVRILAFAHDDADRAAARELEGMGYAIRAFPHDRRRAQVLSLPLLLTRKPLTLGVYGSRALQREVDRTIGGFDLAYAFSSSMGAFVLPHGGLPRVAHFADLDSDKWKQYAESTPPPMRQVYRREWRTLLAFETRLAAACDQNVFCTQLEERLFREQIPGRPSSVLRMGVELDHFTPRPELAEPGHVMFCGVMDYLPNVDACTWFAREILPMVRRQVPDARFTIVGAHPAPQVRKLAELEGVEVTGFVDDTRTWLHRAAVSVAPLRIARGIQNKVLEAMGMGLPIVGTSSATQGVAAREGTDYLVADTAEEIAEDVCGLLRDRERARELGSSARAFVEEHYDWERIMDGLAGILASSVENYRQKAT